MFNFLKRKKQTENSFLSPSEVFKSFGPSMSLLWESFIEGQNRAVEIFAQFNIFKTLLDNEYPLDFNRFLSNIKLEGKDFEIRVKHGIFLYISNIEDDYYVTFDGITNVDILSRSECDAILSKLSCEELEYSQKLREYIQRNILPIVNETDLTRFGIKMCKRPIPLNSLELNKYHRYIAEGDYVIGSEEYKKWHHISNAPFLFEKNNLNNPLVITEVTSITAFVLDYLCYATISLPTLDLMRVLSYEHENGRSVEDTLRNTFGQRAIDYITKVVNDINGSLFRTSVFNGMLIK